MCHDGSPEVLEAFAAFGITTKAAALQVGAARKAREGRPQYGRMEQNHVGVDNYGDTGTAARFFPALGFGGDELRFHYSAKANKRDRAGSKHPTVKPQSLLKWLCRLITPPGGRILDPFAGSGSLGEAAMREGFSAVLIEREAEYFEDARRRLATMKPERSAKPERPTPPTPSDDNDMPLFASDAA